MSIAEPSLSEFGEAAKQLGEEGCQVFPLQSKGKRPLLTGNWQDHATSESEKIEGCWTEHPSANVAVVMGPESGVIDVECDSEAEEAALRETLGDDASLLDYTPQFRSRRGKHYLFQWDARFTNAGATVDVNGVKWRLHHCYSVFPPSVHPDGLVYTWEPGFSLEEGLLHGVPEHVVRQLLSAKSGANGSKEYEHLLASNEPIPEGKRHSTLLSEIGLFFSNVNSIGDKTVGMALQHAHGVNQTRCQPPLPDDEVERMVRDIAAKEAKERGSMITSGLDASEMDLGRQVERDAEVEQGEETERKLTGSLGDMLGSKWGVELVMYSQPRIRIKADAFLKNGDGVVEMDFEELRDVRKAESAIFAKSCRRLSAWERKHWQTIVDRILDKVTEVQPETRILDARDRCLFEIAAWLRDATTTARVSTRREEYVAEKDKQAHLPHGQPILLRDGERVIYRTQDLRDYMHGRPDRWSVRDVDQAVQRLEGRTEMRVWDGGSTKTWYAVDRDKLQAVCDRIEQVAPDA